MLTKYRTTSTHLNPSPHRTSIAHRASSSSATPALHAVALPAHISTPPLSATTPHSSMLTKDLARNAYEFLEG
ncbi:hypothetical protein BDD12DRAFT_840675 [Trichophaea hybrida]|nr:hypothetical protein BDD12DRAFT_840675 [Trichophaea hybrida]